MVTLEPKHLAARKRADPVTKSAVIREAPNYGAYRRQAKRRGKTCDVLVEAEPPKLEADAPEMVQAVR